MKNLMISQPGFISSRILTENNNPKLYPCGVYLNMPDEEYFSLKAVGSTDLVKLCRTPANWWWSSPFNPRRELKDKKHYDFGKALHKYVLEGVSEYYSSVIESPYAAFTTKEAKLWRADQIEDGKIVLKSDDIYAVEHLGALMNAHPDTKDISSGLCELVVIWHDENGIAYRAKFDGIVPSMTMDLKSYGGHNAQGRSPYDTAMRMIAMRSYDIQRYQYDKAREMLRQFVIEGQVYGNAEPEQLQKLEDIAAADSWGWVWCFYQKLDCKEGHAPVVVPIGSKPFDFAYRSGQKKANVAIENLTNFIGMHSLEKPWAQINQLKWAEDTDYLPWMDDIAAPEEFLTYDEEGE